MLNKIMVFLILALLAGAAAFAQTTEEITITTYYPSPFGVYNELRSERMAIGANYFDNTNVCWGSAATCPAGSTVIPTAAGSPDVDLVVEGRVGIGTTAPEAKFEVYGSTPTDIRLWDASGSGSPDIRIKTTGGIVDREWSTRVYPQDGRVAIVDRTASADRLTILTTGNVGIGDMSPDAVLDIASTAAMNLFRVDDSGDGDTSPFVIDQNGNVGIGTTAPTVKLDVNGDIKWIHPFNTGSLNYTIEGSAQETSLIGSGCVKLDNENAMYGTNHWMSCPTGYYVAAITDDDINAQDVMCCPF